MDNNFLVVLDAGHGEGKKHNRGGVFFNEGDNNFLYTEILKNEFLKLENISVKFTRNKLRDNPSLEARAKEGNGANLFLSIHSNAFNGLVRGTEIFDNIKKPNKQLADRLCAGISTIFAHNNRGLKYKIRGDGENWYGVLYKNPAQSAMLIEHGFHDNSADCRFFMENHKKIAEATVKIIADFYNLSYKNNNLIENIGPSEIYRVCIGAFKEKYNAENRLVEAKLSGFSDAYIFKI